MRHRAHTIKYEVPVFEYRGRASYVFYECFSMRRRDHPVFYHSNCSSDLKRSSKINFKLNLGPKTAQEGPRTPSTQTVGRHLEPKWPKKEAVLRLNINKKKTVLDLGAGKVVHVDAQGSSTGSSGPRKSKNSFGWGCIFQHFTRLRHKAIFDQYSTP